MHGDRRGPDTERNRPPTRDRTGRALLAAAGGLAALLAGCGGRDPEPERPLTVRNDAERPRKLRVTLGRNGAEGLLVDRRLSLAAGERVAERVRVDTADRYVLSATLATGDGAAEFQRLDPGTDSAFFVTATDEDVTVRILAGS